MKKNKKGKKRVYKNNKWYAKLIRNIVYFIIGSIYSLILILKGINMVGSTIYLKLPKVARIVIIYALIGLSINGLCQKERIVIKEIVKEEQLNIVVDKKSIEELNKKQQELIQLKQENSCDYGNIECKIYRKAKEIGLNHNQALIVMAISKHETGNWTSKAFNNKHNLGGVMCRTGLKQYDSLEDGIDGFVNLLKNRYFDKGLDTIDKIGAIYCPVGASNDPTGVNQYWIPNVKKYYNNYLG